MLAFFLFKKNCGIVSLQRCKKGLHSRCFPANFTFLFRTAFCRTPPGDCLSFWGTCSEHHNPSRSLQPDDGDMADPSLTSLHD